MFLYKWLRRRKADRDVTELPIGKPQAPSDDGSSEGEQRNMWTMFTSSKFFGGGGGGSGQQGNDPEPQMSYFEQDKEAAAAVWPVAQSAISPRMPPNAYNAYNPHQSHYVNNSYYANPGETVQQQQQPLPSQAYQEPYR